ncbi:T9SS type A sorting domain-containing protein [Brumimicrobium glaciale]|uniref:T9SS type A sorting domain-containing protein n=1 Tax=Brumimicrobium glaciale TaxID=200475 RepID=A0A4Q4KH28_9FLAO|nr:zinc-dependent metalloprotease [Brumimicrobium glaciale]RYM32415.1 T9SS type A sorting domain-containing protein [Brumimicrobium glaciale]
MYNNYYGRYQFSEDIYDIRNIIEIPIDVHIWQKDNSTGNYIDNVFNRTVIEDAMVKINEIFTDITTPSDVIPGVVNYESSKIIITLGNIFFNQNTSCWSAGDIAGPSTGEYLNSEANILHPGSSKNFKIHFTGASPAWSGFGRFPSFTQDHEHYVVTYNSLPMFGNDVNVPNALAVHLAHELGHNLDLYHTYQTSFDACNENNPDYLDDVFGSGINKVCPHDAGWECITTSPLNSCTNNIMGGSSGAKYISPNQVHRMHRALSMGSIRNYAKVHSFDENLILEVNQDETWDFSVKLFNSLRIKSGNTLIIRCEIQFVPEAKLIIEQGAKVILDGGTLTNEKFQSQYWQGIQVYGTSNQHQYPVNNPTHQGMLEIKNGGTIENAHKAVTNWKEGSWNEIGGVIKSTDGFFRNNRRGVEFMVYQNFHPSNSSIKRDNTSSFTDTDFLTDDDFIEGHPQQPHVSMWKVQGINFTNCHFANNVTSSKSLSSSPNEGITALDASFRVLPRCDSPPLPVGQSCPSGSLLRSSFSGLEFAVQIAGAGITDAVTVTQADFTNNNMGIYVDEFDNINLNRNDFIIGNSGYLNSVYPGNGITLDNSTGFIVEENSVLSNMNGGKTSGIVVINSGSANNQVYKNSLNNLYLGTQASKINRKLDLHLNTGLQFLCNDYVQNRTAISVSYPSPGNGIRYYQGEFYPKTSAGNTFLLNNMDITNNTNSHFNYYHSGGNTLPNVVTGPVDPIPNSALNACPTSFTSGISMFSQLVTELSDYEIELANHKTAYNILNYNYVSLIDNGNTEIFQGQIENNWSSDAWILRNELMQESPYLSSEALLTAAGENILPNAMLLEVLLANPDATRGEDFINKLNEVTGNALPEYMLNYVRNNWDTETVRTTLEGEMMSYQAKIASANSFIKYLEKSKEEHTYAERHNTVLMGEGVSNKIGLMDFFIENSEWSRADSVLQALNSDESLEGDLGLLDDFDNYITFRSSLGERSVAELDSSEISYLETLAEKGSRASGYAENILCFFYDICYEKEIPEGGSMAKMLTIPAPSGNEPSLEEIMYNITVYPNPASDFTSIKWEVYDELNNAHYKIFDLNGREMGSGAIEKNEGEKVVDTRSLTNGVYIINIYNDGIMKMNSKLIVSKEK